MCAFKLERERRECAEECMHNMDWVMFSKVCFGARALAKALGPLP